MNLLETSIDNNDTPSTGMIIAGLLQIAASVSMIYIAYHFYKESA